MLVNLVVSRNNCHIESVYFIFNIGKEKVKKKRLFLSNRDIVMLCFVFQDFSLKKKITKLWCTFSNRALSWVPELELISWDGCQLCPMESEWQQAFASLWVSASCTYLQTLLFCLSRLNSIDVKYQMWKLGVVFTDNVSQLHYHKVKRTLIRWVCWISVAGKMAI